MNVFDLQAKISLDAKDYEKGLGEANSKFSGFADGLKSAVGKVGDVLAGIGKAAAVGVGAASTALTALTKQTLDAVGNFEQLEGGAQKIFDEMDFEKISRDAKNAYKELNMSASEYLEAINLAGATFAQTMGDEKGYDTARKGMLAIADYASGTGRNLEELNQKYQMITRATSSYQSIADQFSGILPATSADFLEQAKAAGYLADTYEKLTEVPVAEYQEALTNMLERGVTNLGLSNNTLRESTETLTGSFAMARAAWQNFLTGQGSTQDFVGAFTAAIEQTKGKLNEIIPRLTEGLTELVDLLAPEIPTIIEETLPTIISASTTLITNLSLHLPEILSGILPALSTGVVDVSFALVKILPQLITSVKNTIPIIVSTIFSKKDDLKKAGQDMIKELFPKGFTGITEITEKSVSVVSEFILKLTNPDNINAIFNTGISFINSIMDGLLSEDSLDTIIETVPQIIQNLADAITNFISGDDGKSGLLGAVENIVVKICDYFDDPDNRKHFEDAALDILITLGTFLENNVDVILQFIFRIAKRIAESLVTYVFDQAASLFDAEAGWMEEYLATDTNLTYEQWAAQKREAQYEAAYQENAYVGDVKYNIAEGMRYAFEEGESVPYGAAGYNEYIKYKESHNNPFWQDSPGYATGFDVKKPTFLSGVQVGESGEEVLLPLDSNTGWMDKLADKLNSYRADQTGTKVIIESITINAPSGDADAITDAFIDRIDEKLRNRQITQNRGVGAVT